MTTKSQKNSYIPKEVSWLTFNERVLLEAANTKTPLIESLKFLGIYSNNLDEFFRVRVATLKRLASVGKKANDVLSYDPKKSIKEINKLVIEQSDLFEKTYNDILKRLEKHNIFIINEKQLNGDQEEYVRNYFQTIVQPELMPMMCSQFTSKPELTNDSIYFIIHLQKTNKEEYALLKIPTKIISRFLVLPTVDNKHYVILLDDIIRLGLQSIFSTSDYANVNAYTIKLTKDAELDIVDNVSEGYIKSVQRSLKKRKFGEPVRFIYDKQMPSKMLKFLINQIDLDKSNDILIRGGKYHNFKDFMKFPNLGLPELNYKSFSTLKHPTIPHGKSLFSTIKEKDQMLYFPYHSFNHFIDLLREASIDPKVESIKITLYRLAKDSSIINALINAATNGKSVTTIIELQARFDEEANIYWSNKLIEGGVKVINGVSGLKVHSKLCLITRKENHKKVYYACVGTGNFNEDTAHVYTDHLLLTHNKRITADVVNVFDFFKHNFHKEQFLNLIVSPFNMHARIVKLINQEIKYAQEGKKACIYIKLNNLSDPELIKLLYKADKVGVEIRGIVRGMCSVVTERLNHGKIIRIVDRFLEHTRFIIFHNNGHEKTFISSADWMTRNIERRVEVTCPIYDKTIQKEVRDIFEIQWADNTKSSLVNSNATVALKHQPANGIRSQQVIFDYYKNLLSK